MNRNNARLQAFNYVRDTSLQALTTPAVLESLGSTADETIALLEDAYMVERRLGALAVPTDPDLKHRLGIHPLLPADRNFPDTDAFTSQKMHEIDQDFREDEQPSRLTAYRNRMTRTDHSGNVACVVTDKRSLDEKLPAPLLMVVGSGMQTASKPVIAAAVAHEADHAIKLKVLQSYTDIGDMHSYARTFPVGTSLDVIATAVEKTAYPVTSGVLQALGAVPEDVNYRNVCESITRTENPYHAADDIKTYFANTFGHLHSAAGRWKPEALALSAYAAMAVSDHFGDGTLKPTSPEIDAYSRLGFIR